MKISIKQEDLLNRHLELVLEANKIHNITNITDFEKAKVLHIEDSLAALEEIKHFPAGDIADLGSGAGYPGIPLAIISNRKTTLLETVGKKADCLKSFVSELSLEKDIFVINDRIETYTQQHKGKYQIVTARALSSLPSLLELASPLLQIGGGLICYKGKNITEELDQAINIQDKLGMKFRSNRIYKLKDASDHRIVVFDKVKEAEIKLPRKLGIAQKRPLIK